LLEGKRSKVKGVSFLLLQALTVAWASILSKVLQQEGLPTSQVYFFQVGLALVFILPWLIRKKFYIRRIAASKFLRIRVVSSTLAVTALFVSLRNISATTALLLFNTGPLFVPFILMVWHKKPIAASKICYTFLGFIGIFLVLDPQGGTFTPYYFLALFAGLSAGFVKVSSSLVIKHHVLERSIFFILLLGVLGSLPFAASDFQPMNLHMVLLALLLGLAWAITQYAFSGYVHGKVSTLSPLLFFSAFFSGVIEYFVFGYAIDTKDIVGFCFILLGSILVVLDE
jgi:drug/metabolite transporter (DMT)-like permease